MTDIDQKKIRRLDFTLLLVFQALLRQRRTTAAARQLGLSQSAISHALTRLRDLFEDPLFIRLPHGMEPTRRAVELSGAIDALLRGADEAMNGARSFDPRSTPRGFRIGASDFLATLLAPRLMRAFVSTAPEARFALRVVLGQAALTALERDEIDIALGRFQRPLAGFEIEPLFTDKFCLVARANHPQLGGKITRSLFQRLDHVAISATGDFRTYTDDDVRDAGLVRRVIATVPRFSIAFGVVAQSDAVALAPARLVNAQARLFRISGHALPTALQPIPVFAVTRLTPDSGRDWLLSLLREALAE